MLFYVIQTTDIESITVYYLIKGHTENDEDMVHSLIERNKESSIMVPNDWCALIRNMTTKKLKIEVKKMKHASFLDITTFMKSIPNLHKCEDGKSTLNWTSVMVLRVDKNEPYVLQYKHDYVKDFKKVHLLQNGGKRKVYADISEIAKGLKPAYKDMLPISTDKFKDLQWMCDNLKNIIICTAILKQ